MSQQKFCLNRYSARSILLSFSGVVLTLLGILTLLPTTAPKDTSAVIDSETYDLYLSASPVEITAGNKGDIALGKSTITSTTLSPAGYELYLSMTSDSNAVRMDSVNSIAATTGTFNTPTALTTDTSASWGYAIAGLNNFDSSYNNISQSSKFAAVPTVANPQLIHNHSGTSANGSNLDIYFGVKAAKNTPSGQYTADIMISSISDMTSEPHKEAEVTEGGELEEGYSNAVAAVRTSLKATSITFTPADLIVTIDGKVCNNVTITQQIPLSITTSVPNDLPEGEYDVEISIPKIGRIYVIEKGIKVTAPAIPKTAKAILGTNGNLNFIYDTNTYTVGETYTDNLGETTIDTVYIVPADGNPEWQGNNNIIFANFEESFQDFKPTSLEKFFHNDQKLSKITNAQNLNTSEATNMAYMFCCAGFKNNDSNIPFIIEGLDDWDVSKVTTMTYMFREAGYYATNWSIGDLSNWDTGNVIDMSLLFQESGYRSATWSVGDLSNWNVGSVTNMSGMFSNAGSNATIWYAGNLDEWNVGNVENMSFMFSYAGRQDENWSIGDISNWNVGNVTDMQIMFSAAGQNATNWYVGDLGKWNVGSVTNMSNMFAYAGEYSETWSLGDLSDWNVSNVTNMSYLFCCAGESIPGKWTVGDLSDWNVGSVTDMSYMFASVGKSASEVALGDIKNWDVSSVTSTLYMFYRFGYDIKDWSIDLTNWNLSSLNNMNYMFYHAGFNAETWTAELSGWNASSATKTQYVFMEAGNNAETWTANLSNWDIGSTPSIANILNSAGSKATTWTADVSGWNISSTTDMSRAFQYAGTDATTWTLNGITGWNTGNATKMDNMFYGVGSKATFVLDLSGWNVDHVTSHSNFSSNSSTARVIPPVWVN